VPLIEARGLVKDFHRLRRRTGRFAGLRTLVSRERETVRAVDGVSFSIEPGELVGYLGPNGAGKSTTIKMLTGILTPTAGEVTVAGVVPWLKRQDNARNIGVVFGQRSQLWWDLPLVESLRLVGKLYRMPRARYEENLAKFVELLDMRPFLDTPVRQLSLGQRMRGDLAAAMIYEPAVLYLDEPTVGLDVIAKERIRKFVADLSSTSGTTVLLTTHDMDDVEALCERLILIDHGKVLYDGTPAALKDSYAPQRELVVQLASPCDVTVAGARTVESGEGVVRLSFDPAETPAAALISELFGNYPVTDVSLRETGLEDVIKKIYAGRS
jgi:ABC-2 type transport system ATP-binding protein